MVNKTTLMVLRGAPGSGKTTSAKMWVDQDPANRVRVNRDDLRMMTFGRKTDLTFDQENVITALSQSAVKESLKAGKDVIVDDMHLRPKYIREWYKIAQALQVNRVSVTSRWEDLDVLLDRNAHRPEGDRLPEEVLRTIFTKFTKKGKFLPVESYWDFLNANEPAAALSPAPPFNPYHEEPHAILVDIDGTLAKNESGRGWFEWEKVGHDSIVEPIQHLVNTLSMTGSVTPIFLSGRDEVCRTETEAWIRDAGLDPSLLFMRPEGDNRPDTEVKYDLFNDNVRDQFNVWFVIDDRPAVCRMWRQIGLTVLQVGDPHVEF